MAQPPYVSIDLETTGLSPERDAIIEVGIVTFDDQRVLQEFSTLVDPGRPVPFQITQLTGIREEDVRGQPAIDQVLPTVRQMVGDATVIGHNVEFDLGFLRKAGLRMSNRHIDTFALASIVMPHAQRYSLGILASELGIRLEDAHRALSDADATRQLFLRLCERAEALPLSILQEINRVAHGSRWPLAALFRSFEHRKSRRALGGGSIGAQLQAKGVGGGDGKFGLLVRSEEEELEPSTRAADIDPAEVVRLLEPDGLVARSFPAYEHRPQQVAMLEAVEETMRHGGVLLVEAGTGTGKSLAYLLPGVYHAVAGGRRAVVSTNTINLQDQLFQKDIPDLRRILPFDVRAAVLKGRSNYLCLRKLGTYQKAGQVTALEMQTLARIMVWSQSTTSGDCGELFLPTPMDRAFWSRLGADSESCLWERCRFYQQRKCFLRRAREQAEAAHLVVVNHSLLLADAVMENTILPDYDYLVIDEAHHLEDATTQQLSVELTRTAIDQELSLLSGAYSRMRQTGLIERIVSLVSPYLSPSGRRDLELLAGEIHAVAASVGNDFRELLRELAQFVEDNTRGDRDYGPRLRITDAIRKQPAWSDIEIATDNLTAQLGELGRLLDRIRVVLREVESSFSTEAALELTRDLGARSDSWKRIQAELSSAITETRPNRIDWLEVRPPQHEAELHSAPLHIGEMVNEFLLKRRHAVVMTSATLRAGDDFSFIRGRLGAYEGHELAVGSPFDYRSSTLIYQPTDIPEPATPFYQQAVSQAVEQVALALRGRTLVLFTSYRQLQATVGAVGEGLAKEGILVLEQGGGGSRAHLLQQFRDEDQAVLFGTRSFWEGVDVMGPALSCVIIVRLPFSVPSDPIFAARSETFDDPFNEYSVPDAVLRFRQGFGRLIRSKTDRGAVVILDRRVSSKRYGQIFLQSLPACTIERGPIINLGLRVSQWING